MVELELVRVEEDGGSLVLRGPDGTQYVLPVTEALRSAVRPVPEVAVHDDVHAGPTPVPTADDAAEPALRPRDLQARLRAGATAEELAPLAAMTVEQVRRYEWPVVAEREHVIGKVRAHEVPGLNGTSELGMVADARLAARGVGQGDAAWSARREGSAPWVVEVRFAAGDRERSARWTFDPRAKVVTPLDDEARWLGQPDDPLTPEVRAVPSMTSRRLPPPDPETDLLLDDLAGRRGSRPPSRPHRPVTTSLPIVGHPAGSGRAAGDDESTATGSFQVVPLGDLPVRDRTAPRDSGPAPSAGDDDANTEDEAREHGGNVVDFGRWNPRRPKDKWVSPGAGPGASQPTLLPVGGDAAAASPAPLEAGERSEPAEPKDETSPTPVAVNASPTPADTPASGLPAQRRSRKGRAQVPSWDEIVFGARPEPG